MYRLSQSSMSQEMTEGSIAGRASKTTPPPPISSKSGSATAPHQEEIELTMEV